ncbi:G-type lectin S-receptor-like serine/threonine-protein kinase [Senna tora]|uniref:G-type lectin S-receptor-like serine/threonine-protein kinase n=1 Tax=Senna tora TaxID=362788 RepID=A0A835CI05_9FABA|nr:G-type lectin S-receptor-like serine/threonine-protein kinase [Senna tora]
MNFRGFLLINLFLDLMLHYCFHLCLGFANDTITSAQFIRDPETLSSNSNDFKLGFFSPQNSTNRYVGIWYLSEANVIWVANRNQGLNDTSGIFRISEDGNLVVLNGQNKSIWSSNVSNIVTTTTNSTAKLLDTGNLVLLHDNTGETIWESFQNPSDFLVPKMKLSSNKITGHKVKITSWKTPSDPSIGDYSASLERPNAPDVFLWFNGTRPYSRTGPWNGRVFMGSPTMSAGYLYGWRVENEEDGTVYLTYNFANDSAFGVIGLSPQGQLWMTWWNQKREVLREVLNGTYCDRYGICGIFGSCNWHNSPICSCLRGYEPRNGEEWNRQNWTSGCVRRRPLKCEEGGELDKEDGFVKLEGVKVPDFVIRSTATEGNCRAECSENCSCVAYGYDLNGIGCMHWSGDLIDIQKFSSGGVDLYIRVANAELEKNSHKRTIIAVTVTVGMLALGACGYLLWKLTARYTGETHSEERMIQYKKQVKLDELPLFDFEVITTATNNFHSTNMLGHGGFGSVYKAWKLWKEDSYVHFIDPELSHQDSSKDILRCIHIGLLCVQELARDRPNMASVVSMLSSETVNLRTPREPPYVQNQTRSNSEYASGTQGSIMELDGATNSTVKKKTPEQLPESTALGRTGISKDADTGKTAALLAAIAAKREDKPPKNIDL